jgi:hypothetical protein
MLYFGDYRWLKINGYSRFTVYIAPQHRQRGEIMWSIQMRYCAAGPAWRRVQQWERPSLWLEVSSFVAPAQRWTDLEQANFWNPALAEDARELRRPSGWFDATFYPKRGHEAADNLHIGDFIWRVSAREGRWFDVELAALIGQGKAFDAAATAPTLVTPDGKEDEPDPEFWKNNANLYLLESYPFGTVTVRAPRNARDVEAYAFGRAEELIGGRPHLSTSKSAIIPSGRNPTRISMTTSSSSCTSTVTTRTDS